MGGSSANGLVTLECAATQGDVLVTLSSNKPLTGAPDIPTVTVPQGMTSVPFRVTTTAAGKRVGVSITATANDKPKSGVMKVTPEP